MARILKAYGRPLETVIFFKYFGWVLTSLDDDWSELVGNLHKYQKSWYRLSIILGMEGASTRVSGMFFKAVVWAVLLFGTGTWAMNPRMGEALGVSNTGP